jgi:hypothetical protein
VRFGRVRVERQCALRRRPQVLEADVLRLGLLQHEVPVDARERRVRLGGLGTTHDGFLEQLARARQVARFATLHEQASAADAIGRLEIVAGVLGCGGSLGRPGRRSAWRQELHPEQPGRGGDRERGSRRDPRRPPPRDGGEGLRAAAGCR